MSEGPALYAIPVDDAAGPGPAEDPVFDDPHGATVDGGHMGHRVFNDDGARLVRRSWGSVRWVSASTTLT